MLYPQSNPYRQVTDLSGFWELRFDPEGQGLPSGWMKGFEGGRPAAVPASWNDLFEDGRDYLGQTWYQTHFGLPWGYDTTRHTISLRFNSVNYLAEAWLNGVRLGQHEGGHLPFEFDVTPYILSENNILVVRVDGELKPDRVPPGNIPPDPHLPKRDETFPSTSFDFFPFCGIQRPVLLSAVPKEGISDISVTTDISGHAGIVRIKVNRAAGDTVIVHAWLRGTDVSTEGKMVDEATIELTVPDAMLWSPDSPYLYDLIVELSGKNTTFDRYSLPIGIRTIKVDGDALLLNGRPVYLRGFGRHEDFPVTGRGLVPAVIVKDYALMKWIGANSFRTSHYPYSEQMMDLADRLGFLVIDEIPAVGLFFDEEGSEHRLSLCRQYLRELIERDKNHPGVIAWSIANEPASSAASKPFFRNLYDLAKSLDTTRPVTLVSEMEVEKREKSFEFLDIVCLNRYYGWYIESGQMDAGMARLAADIDAMHEQFKKPIIMTEFGADAMSGHHAQPPEMFSEEYQAELLTRYINLFKSRPFIVGEHVWNLCDFKTAQRVRRAGSMNLKGVFTRDRRPKMAAHRLRELWTKPQPDKTG